MASVPDDAYRRIGQPTIFPSDGLDRSILEQRRLRLLSEEDHENSFLEGPEFEWVFKANSLQKSSPRFPDFFAAEGLLTHQECEVLIELAKDLDAQRVALSWGSNSTEQRNTDLFWVMPTEETYDVFEKILDYVAAVNDEYFGFDLNGYTRAMQLGRYRIGHGYDWHQDLGPHSASKRKLSMIIQLTDDTAYDGGDVQFFRNDYDIATAPSSQGSIALFPSWMVHRVQRISSGERWSLVSWFEGPPFR